MLAFDQDTWTTEQETATQSRRFNNDELDRERLLRAETPDPDEDDYDDDLDVDDDDDDLGLDDDDDLDDDVVPSYDPDLDDEDDEDLNDPLRAEYDEEDGFEDPDDDGPLDANDPNEIPEHEETDNEKSGYPREQEVRRPQEGNDASYSEQTDVTPPRTHEFPSEGSPKTDFSSRPHGRTTGRMVGHEPGTEGI